MNDCHTRPSHKPLWSALRYPSTGWVSEILVRQMNRAIACERGAGNIPEQSGRIRRNPGTIQKSYRCQVNTLYKIGTAAVLP